MAVEAIGSLNNRFIGLSVLCLLWTACAFFTFQIGRFSFLMVFFLALFQGAYLTQRRAS